MICQVNMSLSRGSTFHGTDAREIRHPSQLQDFEGPARASRGGRAPATSPRGRGVGRPHRKAQERQAALPRDGRVPRQSRKIWAVVQEARSMTDYLTVAEVLAMHADQIERYGGSPGVRDQGLLEAALYRPQTGYYADLIEEAAALWESRGHNHSFVDGNQRTAFAATETFLAINGLYLRADSEETYLFIADLYKVNQFRFDKLVPWLRAHVEKTT